MDRPGVAGAVLQTALSLINSVRNPFPKISLITFTLKPLGPLVGNKLFAYPMAKKLVTRAGRLRVIHRSRIGPPGVRPFSLAIIQVWIAHW